MLICQVLDFLRSYSHSVSDPLALVTFVHVTLTHYLFAKAVVAACIGAKFGIDGNPGELPKWYAIVVVLFICIYVAGFAWSWGPLGWLVPSESSLSK
ncbi:hypothetical protein WN943_008669 [Citrus x changshan-huyou]